MDHTDLEPTNICVSLVGEVTYIGPHGPPLDRTLRSANAANLSFVLIFNVSYNINHEKQNGQEKVLFVSL